MIAYARTLLVSSNDTDKIARVAKQTEELPGCDVYEKYNESHDYYDNNHFEPHNTCGDSANSLRANNHQSRNQIYTRCKATDMHDIHNDYITMRSTTYPSFHTKKPPETIFEENEREFVSDDYVSICSSCRSKKLVRDIKQNIKTLKDSFTNTAVSNFRDTFTECVMHNSAPGREYITKPSAMPLYDKGFPEKEYSYKGYSKEYPYEKQPPYRYNYKKHIFEKELPYRDNSTEYSTYPFTDDYVYEAPNVDAVRYTDAETQTRKDSECNTDIPIKENNKVNLIQRALEKEAPVYRDVKPSKRPQHLKGTIISLVDKGTELPDLKVEETDLENPKTKYMLLLKNIDGTIEEAIEISKAARKVLYNEGISDIIVDKFVEAKPLETIKKDAETAARKKRKIPFAEKLYKSVKSRYNNPKNEKNDNMKSLVERLSPTALRKGQREICVKQCLRQEFSSPPRRMICSAKEIDPRLRYRLTPFV